MKLLLKAIWEIIKEPLALIFVFSFLLGPSIYCGYKAVQATKANLSPTWYLVSLFLWPIAWVVIAFFAKAVEEKYDELKRIDLQQKQIQENRRREEIRNKLTDEVPIALRDKVIDQIIEELNSDEKKTKLLEQVKKKFFENKEKEPEQKTRLQSID